MKTNIEIAHIYADSEMGEAQKKTIRKLKELAVNGERSVSILVDEYKVTQKTLDLYNYVEAIKKEFGVKVDYAVYESGLTAHAEEVLARLPREKLTTETMRKRGASVVFWNDGNAKIPLKETREDGTVLYMCPLLTTVWQLTRLGAFEFKYTSLQKFTSREVYADRVVSILDKSFQKNEENVIMLLKEAGFGELAGRITYEFV